MSKKLHVTNLLGTVIIILCFGCIPQNIYRFNKKYWTSYYQKALTPGSIVVSAGPTQTVERINDRYIRTTYFCETKMITSRQSFKDVRLTIYDGPLVSYTDWGTKMVEANYVNDQRSGEELKYDMTTGKLTERATYIQGKKTGLTTQYDSTSNIVSTAHYRLDSLDGEYVMYHPDGSIKLQRVYKNGQIISGTPEVPQKPINQVQPTFPCNPNYKEPSNCPEYSMMRYIHQTIRYPSDALQMGIQGTVMVRFWVEVDGSISDIRVIRGYCESISKESIRLVSKMPKWTPGYTNGVPTRSVFILPLSFKIAPTR